MNNKPVAYINEEDGLVCAKCYKQFKLITNEEIHNIYLYPSGIAEGLLRAGADADFPVMFVNALLEFYELRKASEK